MEQIIESIQRLEATINKLEEENKELKKIVNELKECNKCEYCEYTESLYVCGCARKICRRCCIINHTKSYRGEPICEIICKYCNT